MDMIKKKQLQQGYWYYTTNKLLNIGKERDIDHFSLIHNYEDHNLQKEVCDHNKKQKNWQNFE